MVKLVYTPDLGSGAARRGGSSPLMRTSAGLVLVNGSNKEKTCYQRGEFRGRTLGRVGRSGKQLQLSCHCAQFAARRREHIMHA